MTGLTAFRRQTVLTTRDRPAERTDDPFLSEKPIAEHEDIFPCRLSGVHRLPTNNYRFTSSDRVKENVSVVVRETNSIVHIGGGKRCRGYAASRS